MFTLITFFFIRILLFRFANYWNRFISSMLCTPISQLFLSMDHFLILNLRQIKRVRVTLRIIFMTTITTTRLSIIIAANINLEFAFNWYIFCTIIMLIFIKIIRLVISIVAFASFYFLYFFICWFFSRRNHLSTLIDERLRSWCYLTLTIDSFPSLTTWVIPSQIALSEIRTRFVIPSVSSSFVLIIFLYWRFFRFANLR